MVNEIQNVSKKKCLIVQNKIRMFIKIKLFADNEYPYEGNEKRNGNENEKQRKKKNLFL